MNCTRFRSHVALLGLLAALLPAPAARAQLLVDPSGGTVLFDSAVRHDDQVVTGRPLGFTLNFYGTAHDTVDVTTNGNLNFSGNTVYTNRPLPDTVARISPYWDDLYIFAGEDTNITEKVGPGYYAVTWNNLGDYHANRLTGDTFQAVIFGGDVFLNGVQFHANDIAFSYQSLFTSNDGLVTVGLDAGDSMNFIGAPGTDDGIISDPHNVPTNNGSILLFRYDGNNGYVGSVTPAPQPLVITSLQPDAAVEGGADFTLTVNGTGFAPTTVVRWNGQIMSSTAVSTTQVTAVIPASLIADAGTANITVQTAHVGTSHTDVFHIKPIVSVLSPVRRQAGQGAFTLTVNGSGYTPGSLVRWNGAVQPTTYVSATQLTAQIPASLTATAGYSLVTVTIPHVATSHAKRFTATP